MGTLTLALILLLPLAFLAGWWVSARRVRRPSPVPLPRAYVQGLGHLLGERNDEAVKTFLDALRRYPESSELLLALGRMFRRRGELERALSVHQHLLDQQELDVLGKQEVLLEMARDYLKAGILNRAEVILVELLHKDGDSLPARQLLAEVYELGGDWEQAIRTRRALRDHGQMGQNRIIALLYCELAEESLRREEAVEAYLSEAERADPQCPRLALLRGRIAHGQCDFEAAARQWSTLLRADRFAVLAQILVPYLESLHNCEASIDCRAWRAQLLALADSASLLLPRLIDAVREVEGDAAVIALLQDKLQEGDDRVVLQLYLRAGGDVTAVVPRMQRTIVELPLADGLFHCQHCGYQTGEFYWRCPSCRHWDTFRSGGLAA
ncbi:tetratricopeptide repeat protein [Acidithiobacillus sp. AMEEHan]|uniref:tetratricopeptide repeat protein n=1 Tax=Acidithiobacillus sp. AMEEHan TaxID=2994951 RepID=UPI0027E45385|nr:tetratricopeptide repeat protein [Acidithiobacillus sp. AMEEHan]